MYFTELVEAWAAKNGLPPAWAGTCEDVSSRVMTPEGAKLFYELPWGSYWIEIVSSQVTPPDNFLSDWVDAWELVSEKPFVASDRNRGVLQ